jgi:hypothetical protein
MPLKERVALIKKIEEIRGSTVISFLTSLRQNVPAQIAEDSVRVFFDHLLLLPSRPVAKFDLFLCSNGGSGTVPWRLVSLFREFSKKFNVLIPYRSYSAATLIALGADEIVMHPFAELDRSIRRCLTFSIPPMLVPDNCKALAWRMSKHT